MRTRSAGHLGRRLVAMSVVAALVAAGCSGDDDTTAPTDTGTAESPTATVTTSITAPPPTTASPVTSAPAPSTTTPRPTITVDNAALQSVLDKWRSDVDAYGATLSMRVPDHDDVHLTSGVDGRDPETPMPTDGRYLIGTLTRTFVAAAALQLVDEGLIVLDEPVDRWLPELPNAQQITLEMLLDFTSGLPQQDDAADQDVILADLSRKWTPEEVLALQLEQPPRAAPGEVFEPATGDTGYVAAGLLIERILGQDLDSAIEQFSRRLKLGDTFLSDGTRKPDRNQWFSLDGNPNRPLTTLDFPNEAYATFNWASRNMHSSSADLLDWGEALYTGSVLSETTTAAMLEMRNRSAPLEYYGLGSNGYCFHRSTCDAGEVDFVGRVGGSTGLDMMLAHHPESGITLVVHTNVGLETGYVRKLVQLVEDALGTTGAVDAARDSDEPVTLRMGAPYCDEELLAGTGSRYTPAVHEFVDRVERRSRGNIDVDITTGPAGAEFCGLPDGEQQVVQGVIDGEFDLAWVGTRVFDTFGVDSFQALHAPLLVDSYPLQAAILQTDMPKRMLAGLDTIAVEGLAVLAGGLRRPIGRDAPLLAPGDWEGITFQLYRSDTQAATVTALGATPTDVVAGFRDAGLLSGEIDGHEHSLRTFVVRANHNLAPYVTANVTLWPETVALIANPDTLAGLSDRQQTWLREAAAAASERSVELYDHEDELVATACEQGARFATAAPADLAALRQAVEPVYANLNADAETATFIAEIDTLKSANTVEPVPIPDGCTGEPPPLIAEGSDDPSILNGSFRVEWSVDELAAAGVRESLVEQYRMSGISTWTFDNGVWTLTRTGTGEQRPPCTGTYGITANTVNIQWTRPCQAWLFTATWQLTENGLVFSNTLLSGTPDAALDVWLAGKPWERTR